MGLREYLGLPFTNHCSALVSGDTVRPSQKTKGRSTRFCIRCAEQAGWKSCDGISQICVRCKDLDEDGWAAIRKSDKKREYKREAAKARKRRSSGSVHSVAHSVESMEDSQTFSQSQAPAASGTPASTISKPPLEEDPPAKHDSILEKLEQRMSDLSGNEQEDDESFDGIPPS